MTSSDTLPSGPAQGPTLPLDISRPYDYPESVKGPALLSTMNELTRWHRERGAPYAHPRRVFFLEKLPLGGTGKLDRTALKRLAAQLPPLESHR